MAKEESINKDLTRRDFLKLSSLGVAVAMVPTISGGIIRADNSLEGKRLAMVIDLKRCTGCGSCVISCKSENNVQTGVAWSSRISKTVGKFPNVRYEYMPTLCNHCENAPCVQGCPTRAMHKSDGDITMHDPSKCIGCRYCIMNCPYGVIHFNAGKTHEFWRDDKPTIENVTSSPAEITDKVGGTVLPYYNPSRELNKSGTGLRYKGVIEKCTLCDHRLRKGELPYCVDSCPANARVFGDLNDPDSKVSQLINKYRPMRLKEDLGTEPKVYYIRNFNPGAYEKSKGTV